MEYTHTSRHVLTCATLGSREAVTRVSRGIGAAAMNKAQLFGRGEVRTTSLRTRSAYKHIMRGTDASQAEGFVQTSDRRGCDGFVQLE